MQLADAFIQSDLQLHSGYTFSLVSVFPGNRTQPFALLTQCSTTEPHRNILIKYILKLTKLTLTIITLRLWVDIFIYNLYIFTISFLSIVLCNLKKTEDRKIQYQQTLVN